MGLLLLDFLRLNVMEPVPMPNVTISSSLLAHAKWLLNCGMKAAASGGVLVDRASRNCYTDFAVPSYIISAISVEAFLNEMFLGDWARSVLRNSPLFAIDKDVLEKLRIDDRIVLVAKLHFGATVNRGEQPYQDFALLLKIRNALVHYKMDGHMPSFFRASQINQLMLPSARPERTGGSPQMPWVWAISTTEGIRWAYNTAVAMIRYLIDLPPATQEEYESRHLMNGATLANLNTFKGLPGSFQSFVMPIEESQRDADWCAAGLPT